MELQYMKTFRSLLYMGLTGNEFMVYVYLLDKWQNVLDKYNNNITLDKVYHSEEQKSIAGKLHFSVRTLRNVLKSLEEKKLLKIACCKEFGEKNTYYMTDIKETDCYKQLETTYKYEYEPKVYNSSAKSSSVSSSGIGGNNTRGTRPTKSIALDYDKLIDYKQVNKICGFLIDNDSFDFTFFDSLDLRRELHLSDFSSTTVTIRQLVDYIKQRYNIDVPEQFLKV